MPRKVAITPQVSQAKSPIGRRKIQKQDQWAGFAQVNIGDHERTAWYDWHTRLEDRLLVYLQEELATGLKLSLVWDGANDCFIASFTGRPDFDGETEWTACLSARAAELTLSLSLLLYKHLELTGGDWSEWLINGVKTKRSFG